MENIIFYEPLRHLKQLYNSDIDFRSKDFREDNISRLLSHMAFENDSDRVKPVINSITELDMLINNYLIKNDLSWSTFLLELPLAEEDRVFLIEFIPDLEYLSGGVGGPVSTRKEKYSKKVLVGWGQLLLTLASLVTTGVNYYTANQDLKIHQQQYEMHKETIEMQKQQLDLDKEELDIRSREADQTERQIEIKRKELEIQIQEYQESNSIEEETK